MDCGIRFRATAPYPAASERATFIDCKASRQDMRLALAASVMIKTKTFDGLCHEILDGPLARHGFAWCGGGVYARAAADGGDSIGLDFRPSRGRFCVMIGYYPNEFRIIDELHPEVTAPNRGYLCRPYLNPERTSWQPRWLKAKDKESAGQSLHQVLPWIEHAGLGWLTALRDRRVFAESSDPVAALSSGFAHELAGNIEVARERYNEMNRRFELIEKNVGIHRFRDGWRDFIFVRAKLGFADALTLEISALAGWSPNIEPLVRG